MIAPLERTLPLTSAEMRNVLSIICWRNPLKSSSSDILANTTTKIKYAGKVSRVIIPFVFDSVVLDYSSKIDDGIAARKPTMVTINATSNVGIVKPHSTRLLKLAIAMNTIANNEMIGLMIILERHISLGGSVTSALSLDNFFITMNTI